MDRLTSPEFDSELHYEETPAGILIPIRLTHGNRSVELRARLERAGQPIGANDLLIAAQALALGHTVVTDNEREFSRIDNLTVENWLR